MDAEGGQWPPSGFRWASSVSGLSRGAPPMAEAGSAESGLIGPGSSEPLGAPSRGSVTADRLGVKISGMAGGMPVNPNPSKCGKKELFSTGY